MKFRGLSLWFFSSLLLNTTHADTVKHPNIDGLGEAAIGYQVVQLPLKKAGGSQEVKITTGSINQDRAKAQLSGGDIGAYGTGPSKELDAQFDAIYRPIDRGILGWRLFIIHKDSPAKFQGVKILDGLKAFTAGQGTGWGDVKTLGAAGLKVATAPTIDNLVKMVEGKRFYFSPWVPLRSLGFLRSLQVVVRSVEVSIGFTLLKSRPI